MLSEELRERIRALKRTIPEGRAIPTDAVVDLTTDHTVVDISDGRDEPRWIEDERVVDLFPAAPPAPTRGLGVVPPLAAPVFRTLEHSDRELAHLVAAGFSDEEISLVLGMAPGAAELAVRSLLSLTGCRNRAEMIVAWHTG